MSSLFDFWASVDDQDRGAWRAIAPWLDLISQDATLASVQIVVEMILGDRARLIACTGSSPLEPPLVSGGTRHILPLLLAPAGVDNSYDIGRSPGTRSMSFQVPAWWFRPMDHIRTGLPLEGYAEVSLLAPGMAWKDRRVIIRGDMANISFGAQGDATETLWGTTRCDESQTVGLTVSDPRSSLDAKFPPWVVDDQTHGQAPPESHGRVYPVVYGRATVDAIQVTSGANPDWLVASGHGWTLVDVWRNDEQVTGDFTLIDSSDDNGVATTLVRPTPAAFTWKDSDRVFVRITKPEMPGVLDVFRDVVERFTPAGPLLLNQLLLAEAERKIGYRPVATQVNSQTTALRWLEEGLFDEFPMLVSVWDQGRYGPVATDWRDAPRTSLKLGGRLYRKISMVSGSGKRNMYNDFLVRFGYDLRLDRFTETASANPGNNAQCAISDLAIGKRVHDPVDLVVSDDPTTASWLVDWMVEHLAHGSLYCEWEGEASLYIDMRRGDSVVLDDLDLDWTTVRATVERISRPPRGDVVVGVRIWQNPHRTGPWL